MSNKFDEIYKYRMATIEDVDIIMKFIKDEWGENHILAYDKSLFLWQYGRMEYNDDNTINFVLMTDNDDKLMGVIGFIAYDRENTYISPSMTQVSPSSPIPMTGLEFMKRQMQMVGEKHHFASGTNKCTILPLYEKVFHHHIGIMQQYYMLNPELREFKVAVPGESDTIVSDYQITEYKLEKVETFEAAVGAYNFEREFDNMPKKSKEFINKRYFKHPYYSYKKWLIRNEKDNAVGFLVGREIFQNNVNILRIVDYRGDLQHLSCLGEPLHRLLLEEKYEYIDLMVSDLSKWKLEKAGFKLLNPDGNTIIPNYFEPFVQENIKNFYQTRTNIVIFKADGDQDRPNRPN